MLVGVAAGRGDGGKTGSTYGATTLKLVPTGSGAPTSLICALTVTCSPALNGLVGTKLAPVPVE